MSNRSVHGSDSGSSNGGGGQQQRRLNSSPLASAALPLCACARAPARPRLAPIAFSLDARALTPAHAPFARPQIDGQPAAMLKALELLSEALRDSPPTEMPGGAPASFAAYVEKQKEAEAQAAMQAAMQAQQGEPAWRGVARGEKSKREGWSWGCIGGGDLEGGLWERHRDSAVDLLQRVNCG